MRGNLFCVAVSASHDRGGHRANSEAEFRWTVAEAFYPLAPVGKLSAPDVHWESLTKGDADHGDRAGFVNERLRIGPVQGFAGPSEWQP